MCIYVECQSKMTLIADMISAFTMNSAWAGLGLGLISSDQFNSYQRSLAQFNPDQRACWHGGEHKIE